MEYLIIHSNEAIGKVVQPKADVSMGVVLGPFVPFLAYENVRSVFRSFAKVTEAGLVDHRQMDSERLNHYYRERDALHLSITTITGLPVETLWINILDFSESLEENGYEAEFCVDYADGAFFSNASLWDGEGER